MTVPPPPVFHTTPESILHDAKTAIAKVRGSVETIIKDILPADATFANVIFPFVHAENELIYAQRLLEFYQYVGATEELRKASVEATKLFAKYDVEINERKDFFALVSAVQDRKEPLNVESQQLVDKLVFGFHRRGLNLDSADRERLQQIEVELEELKNSYVENQKRSQQDGVWFTRSELDGVSEKLLDKLKLGKDENEGKVFLTFSHAHSHAGLRFPKDSEVRRRYYIANSNKCRENLDIHKRTLILREAHAQLLGYKNYAQYSLAGKMAKTPQIVNNFLEDLFTRLTPKRLALQERWRRMKTEDQKVLNQPDDGKFYDWDRFYYTRQMLDQDFVDEQKVSEYFSFESLVPNMLNIYENLFAVKFEPIKSATWHEDVTVYSVRNQDRAGSNFIGWLYLDLYPRPGKWPGFADMPVRPGFIGVDGKRVHQVTSLVCNMVKPSYGNPTLLRHREVVVLFHELGHGIHDLLSETAFARFSGVYTVRDFVETPSQMMENWCWEASTLKLIGQHFSKTKDNREVPEELITALRNGRETERSLEAMAHCQLATFDMAIHQASAKDLDTTRLWNELSHKLMGVDIHPDQKDFAQHATYGQFVNNAVNFFCYLRSQVFSCDMYQSAFKEDPMNQEQGLRYRYAILAKGGSQDEMDQLKGFLGREPSNDALYKDLGLL